MNADTIGSKNLIDGFFDTGNQSKKDSTRNWFSGLGTRVIEYVVMATAGSGASDSSAASSDDSSLAQPKSTDRYNPQVGMGCCHLASTNQCDYPKGGSKAAYTCPDRYTKVLWHCVQGSTRFGCGECSETSRQPTPADNVPEDKKCYWGPWQCSIWWTS